MLVGLNEFKYERFDRFRKIPKDSEKSVLTNSNKFEPSKSMKRVKGSEPLARKKAVPRACRTGWRIKIIVTSFGHLQKLH